MISHSEWLKAIAAPQTIPLETILRYMYRRVRRRRVLDCFVLMLGDEGAGKTDLAILVARRLDRGFTADRVAYSHAAFMDLARRRNEIPRGSVIIIDEGALLAFNLDFAKADPKNLVKYLMAFRERGLIVILAIQRKRRLLPSVEERGHIAFITQEHGDDQSLTRVFRNPGSNQFSKKGTRWVFWAPFRWRGIDRDHPAWELKQACKAKKEATVDQLGDAGAGEPSMTDLQIEGDLEDQMEVQARKILQLHHVRVGEAAKSA